MGKQNFQLKEVDEEYYKNKIAENGDNVIQKKEDEPEIKSEADDSVPQEEGIAEIPQTKDTQNEEASSKKDAQVSNEADNTNNEGEMESEETSNKNDEAVSNENEEVNKGKDEEISLINEQLIEKLIHKKLHLLLPRYKSVGFNYNCLLFF